MPKDRSKELTIYCTAEEFISINDKLERGKSLSSILEEMENIPQALNTDPGYEKTMSEHEHHIKKDLKIL